jgi:methionine sulfoxide reductase heme-binding subunit
MSEIPWTWFAMRSSGLVAVALLTVAVALGIIGPRLTPTLRLTSITIHRGASIAGSALIAGHVVLAILDKWIVLDWPAALLPGVAGWERWGVALGALAVDLMIALVITTATRMRWPRLWRRAHLVAYPVWALAIGHGLLVGSDAAAMQILSLASAGIVLLATAARLVTRPRIPAPPPATRPVATGGTR